ncbi:MAG TPA: DUF305 domain-containing protein [Nocardioides sp.]|nr:DUF305 domain-containing protein [Nocardioides sp.]
MSRIVTVVIGVLAAVASLTGCSGEDHNEADVAFATGMVEHHAQAIQMANFTIGRDGLDPRIAELAEEIRISQTAEIDELAGLLRAWGEEVPETGYATGDSHSHDGGASGGDHADMPGMMSSSDLDELASTQGEAFAERWMRMMIEHHEGALTMVEEVRADGEHEGLRRLAEQMESAQRTEIGDLERWLTEL